MNLVENIVSCEDYPLLGDMDRGLARGVHGKMDKLKGVVPQVQVEALGWGFGTKGFRDATA